MFYPPKGGYYVDNPISITSVVIIIALACEYELKIIKSFLTSCATKFF